MLTDPVEDRHELRNLVADPEQVEVVAKLARLARQHTAGRRPSAKPRLVLIGDSTVKNGRGRGDGGLYGWGQVIDELFDLDRIEIENRALGGRSSRTYLTESLWASSLEQLRPGDFVLIQFGHNDGGQMFVGNRPRASIKGNGDETKTGIVEQTDKQETVHSYGWYLRQYIADARRKGAIPIVLSPIPRDRWQGGRVIRAGEDYGRWAREAAEQAKAAFIDFNEIVARQYEELGEDVVGRELFTPDDWTHTTYRGAVVNARCLVEGIRSLQRCNLADYIRNVAEEPTAGRTRAGAAEASPNKP